MSRRISALVAVLPLLVAFHAFGRVAPAAAPREAATTIEPNENTRAAGTLAGRTLTVSLEARSGTWYPEGPKGMGLEVAAFAEPGKPMQNPGPLIRVRVGTEVKATLRNALSRPLTVFGFGATRGMSDSVVLGAGATREVRFVADVPGTYYYAARSTPGPFGLRNAEDSQLHGAIVVDSANARGTDRVFLMSWWFTIDSTSPTGLGRGTMAINGLSWPHTERLDMVQGDTVSWRVLNLTESDHPMHLHGFYFRMDAKGNGIRDSIYARANRRLGVTEILPPFQTMALTWAPTRPGNWIYHCHFAGHLSHHASLDSERGKHDESGIAQHGSDRPHQMYGLVMGIRVEPRGEMARSTRAPRALRMTVREKAKVYGEKPGYAFVLDGTPEASDPNAMPLPGPTLVLQKDEPVAVMIVNRSNDRAAIHWHGIELESYPDGVPDWSGQGTNILPSIAPGDSLTVRFTPPRAGTFMYHSHFNEYDQINSGLYAPIVVLEPGQRYDPETDRILFFSSEGPTENVIAGPWTPTLLNGRAQPDPMEFRAGTTYRLRLVNMTSDVNTIVTLLDGVRPVQWRALAKDGATLPKSQATTRPAALFFDPGEIYDFEFTPRAAGELALRFGSPDAPPEFGLPKTVTVAVRVK